MNSSLNNKSKTNTSKSKTKKIKEKGLRKIKKKIDITITPNIIDSLI